jgi:hypothetical protein
MKKQINEIKKMQLLAGLITESEYQEEMMNTEVKSSEDKEKANEVYGFENDDLIYDNMVTMDIDQLISDMLKTVESDPSITLKDYLLKYDSSIDDDDDFDSEEEIINEAEISNSEIYEYVSKNYKPFIAPGVQKMLEGLDKKFNDLDPKQQKLVFDSVSRVMKYQMEVWNN